MNLSKKNIKEYLKLKKTNLTKEKITNILEITKSLVEDQIKLHGIKIFTGIAIGQDSKYVYLDIGHKCYCKVLKSNFFTDAQIKTLINVDNEVQNYINEKTKINVILENNNFISYNGIVGNCKQVTIEMDWIKLIKKYKTQDVVIGVITSMLNPQYLNVQIKDSNILGVISFKQLGFSCLTNEIDSVLIGKTFEFLIIGVNEKLNTVYLSHKAYLDKCLNKNTEFTKLQVGDKIQGYIQSFIGHSVLINLGQHGIGMLSNNNISWFEGIVPQDKFKSGQMISFIVSELAVQRIFLDYKVLETNPFSLFKEKDVIQVEEMDLIYNETESIDDDNKILLGIFCKVYKKNLSQYGFETTEDEKNLYLKCFIPMNQIGYNASFLLKKNKEFLLKHLESLTNEGKINVQVNNITGKIIRCSIKALDTSMQNILEICKQNQYQDFVVVDKTSDKLLLKLKDHNITTTMHMFDLSYYNPIEVFNNLKINDTLSCLVNVNTNNKNQIDFNIIHKSQQLEEVSKILDSIKNKQVEATVLDIKLDTSNEVTMFYLQIKDVNIFATMSRIAFENNFDFNLVKIGSVVTGIVNFDNAKQNVWLIQKQTRFSTQKNINTASHENTVSLQTFFDNKYLKELLGEE